MPDYARGKIYKITSGELIYIGSTCEPTLAKRLAQHMTNYKRWKDGKRGNTTSFQLIDTGNYEITLVELCACGSKDELTARERHWVETTPCVNKIIPGRTPKEYKEHHKEDIKEYQKNFSKKYRDDNKERIKEQKKKFREDHPEINKEKCKAWYQANKEKKSKANKEKRLQKSQSILE